MTAQRSDTARPEATAGAPPVVRELELTRVFDAPRSLVFQAWTDPGHFVRWFGPHGVDIPFCEIDPQPGGVIRFAHRFGAGQQLWVQGVFREVDAPARLVFTGGFVDAEGRPGRPPMFADWPLDAEFTTTVLLEEVAGGTKLTVRQRIVTADAAAVPTVERERTLAREGWLETLDRLAGHLANPA